MVNSTRVNPWIKKPYVSKAIIDPCVRVCRVKSTRRTTEGIDKMRGIPGNQKDFSEHRFISLQRGVNKDTEHDISIEVE